MSHLEENGPLPNHSMVLGGQDHAKLSWSQQSTSLRKAWIIDNKLTQCSWDFSQAFDMVPHLRLMDKLDYYGIRNSLKDWIRDFLAHRTQQVNIEGVSSPSSSVDSGSFKGAYSDQYYSYYTSTTSPTMSQMDHQSTSLPTIVYCIAKSTHKATQQPHRKT